jgi:hypothetical protein
MKPMTARYKWRQRTPAAARIIADAHHGENPAPIAHRVIGFLCFDCGENSDTDNLPCPKCGCDRYDKIYSRLQTTEAS